MSLQKAARQSWRNSQVMQGSHCCGPAVQQLAGVQPLPPTFPLNPACEY